MIATIGNGIFCRVGTRTARATDTGMVFPALVDTRQAGSAVLTERDVTAITGVSGGTLRQLHIANMGPAYTYRNGVRFYSPDDVLAWNAQRSVEHKRLMASYGAAL